MEEWLHPFLRALHYALLLGLFGLTAFPLTGLRGVYGPRASAPTITLAVLAPIISAALMLVGIAAMMGQPVATLDWPTVEAIVMSTSIGWAFALRLILLVAAVVALRNRPFVAAALYAITLMTLPWSGHAAASEGALGLFHRLNDGLHLLAAGLWIGAIGWYSWALHNAHKYTLSARPLLIAMQRFAPFGVVLVTVVTLTGVINAQLIFGLGNGRAILTTGYGQLLALKIVLVGLMLLCASRHAAIARNAVLAGNAPHAEPAKILAAARTSLVSELALALAAIGTVAALGLLSPMIE